MKKIILILMLIPFVSFGQDEFEVVPLDDDFLNQSYWKAVENSDAGRAGVKIWFKLKTPVGQRYPLEGVEMHHTYIDYNYYYDGKETKTKTQYLNYDLDDGFFISPLGRIKVRFLLNKTRDTLKIEHEKAKTYQTNKFEKVVYFTRVKF